MTTEIKDKVSDILSAYGVIYNATYQGQTKRDSASISKDTLGSNNWDCDQWSISLKKAGKPIFTTEFFTGLGNRKTITKAQGAKPVKPHATDVLYSLLSDSEAVHMSFNDWCGDYGYSNDSIDAFNTYQKCCSIGEKLASLFSRDQVKELKDLLQDY